LERNSALTGASEVRTLPDLEGSLPV